MKEKIKSEKISKRKSPSWLLESTTWATRLHGNENLLARVMQNPPIPLSPFHTTFMNSVTYIYCPNGSLTFCAYDVDMVESANISLSDASISSFSVPFHSHSCLLWYPRAVAIPQWQNVWNASINIYVKWVSPVETPNAQRRGEQTPVGCYTRPLPPSGKGVEN